MPRCWLSIAGLLTAIALIAPAPAWPADVQVMTQNQYLGADLTPVLQAASAGDPVAFNAAIVAALQQIAANRPAERMAAQAGLISRRQPQLVGLQESYLFGCADPYGTGLCAAPAIAGAFANYLDLTVAALGGRYSTAAIVVNLNVQGIPVYLDASSPPIFLSVVDRDAILRRNDVATTHADFGCSGYVSADGCNYTLALPAGPFEVKRGYVGVDTTIDSTDYRVVNTHLEVRDPPVPAVVQTLQAQELVGHLAATPSGRSLIVMGDFNSMPEDAYPLPYAQLASLGYADVWMLRPGNVPGLTCCQAGNLANRTSMLTQRIDLIFALDAPGKVKQARVVGDDASAKTMPHGTGLWASDHGAVTADLQY